MYENKLLLACSGIRILERSIAPKAVSPLRFATAVQMLRGVTAARALGRRGPLRTAGPTLARKEKLLGRKVSRVNMRGPVSAGKK